MRAKWRAGWAGLICCVAAVLLDFSHFHLQQTSDSLLPVLGSLLHWTPFFWGQSYYGMLWGGLLQPVHSPLVNFLLHNGICFAIGLGVHFLVAAYLLREEAFLWAGTLSAAALIGFTSPHWSFTHVAPMLFYATPMALGVAGMWTLEATGEGWGRLLGRWGLALALMSLATWVNASASLYLGVLLVGRHGLRPTAAMVRGLFLLAFGAGWGMVWMRAMALSGPSFELIAWRMWPLAIAAAGRDAVHTLRDDFVGLEVGGIPPLFLFFGLCLALATALGCSRNRGAAALRAQLPRLGRAAAMCALFACFVSVQRWAQLNGYSGRYWYPICPILQVLIIAAAVLPLYRLASPAWRRVGDGGAALLVWGACVLSFGWPSMQTVRQDMARWSGDYGAVAVASRANFIGGDYWRVWPAVFDANRLLYEQGKNRTVWGIANKANQQLAAVPPQQWAKARILVARGDAAFLAAMLGGGRLQLLQRSERFDLFTLRR